MISSTAAVGLTSLIVVLVYALFKRFTRPSLSMIRGPKSPSFIFGNLLELFQRPVGETEFTWQSLYGNIVRFKGVFGEERLLVADPKALQKMLNTSGYTYSKPPNIRAMFRLIIGQGVFSADGEVHKRQRSIALSGLGQKESKEFFPVFKECAESLSIKWFETIQNGDSQTAVVDVLAWLSRGALDAFGQAVFDVQFGTIQDDSHFLAKKYKNIFGDIFGLAPVMQIFIQAASIYIPICILNWIADHGSHPRLARARDVKDTVTDVAQNMLREKANALIEGMGNQDIFTLLLKANMDANARNKLSDEELFAQIHTILIAAHETVADSLAWILLEIARNPNVQSRLRNEIRKTEATVQARGDPHLTVTDLAGMPYLNAVIKEGLRFHTVAPHAQRIACRDDVLPLSKPILTESGNMIKEVLVPKGTQILISTAAFNRDKDIWGEDAHEFNPERWLNGTIDAKKSAGLGVYSHLMTFLSGTRGCLGWRLAVMKIQTFLFEVVGKFELGMTDKAERILRQLMLLMAPVVDGELDRGAQMPLAISLAPRDGRDLMGNLN